MDFAKYLRYLLRSVMGFAEYLRYLVSVFGLAPYKSHYFYE